MATYQELIDMRKAEKDFFDAQKEAALAIARMNETRAKMDEKHAKHVPDETVVSDHAPTMISAVELNHDDEMFANWNVNHETNSQYSRAYGLAWELGHSNGLSEVEHYFDEIMYVITGRSRPD